MGLLANEKRELAESCLLLSAEKDFEKAAKIRQEAYKLNPPGSINIDWGDWESAWIRDSRYVDFMLSEDYSDCKNSKVKIEFIQAGIFVDYLFGFKDCWGVKRQAELSKEVFNSELLEKFLIKENWDFLSENRELIYTSTKKRNISARIYYDEIKKKGFPDTAHPKIYELGEYYLGFLPGTPKSVIEGRRKWLETYDLFCKMSVAGIDKFPKTYQTFEKHALSNSGKYQKWMSEYLNKGDGNSG